MRQTANRAWAVAVMAAWAAVVVWAGTADLADSTLIPIALGASFVAGFLAGTPWAAAAPFVVVVGIVAWDLVTPDEPGTYREISWLGVVLILGMYAFFPAVFIAAGVAARRLIGWIRGGGLYSDGRDRYAP